jgi:hypothetical protein
VQHLGRIADRRRPDTPPPLSPNAFDETQLPITSRSRWRRASAVSAASTTCSGTPIGGRRARSASFELRKCAKPGGMKSCSGFRIGRRTTGRICGIPRHAGDPADRSRRQGSLCPHGGDIGRRMGNHPGPKPGGRTRAGISRDLRGCDVAAAALQRRTPGVRSCRGPGDDRPRVRRRSDCGAARQATARVADSGRLGSLRVRGSRDRRPAGEPCRRPHLALGGASGSADATPIKAQPPLPPRPR